MSLTDTLQKELVNDLLLESHEGLDRFDRELLAMEAGGGGSEAMNTVFRVIHTLKGTAGCLGFGRIEKTAHCGENLLSLLRDGKLTTTPEMISTLLSLSDALRGMLRCIEAGGTDGTNDHPELKAKLEALQNPDALPAAPAAVVNEAFGLFEDEAPAPTLPATIAPPVPAGPATTVPNESSTRSSVADNAIRVDVGQLDKVMNLVGELVLARNQIVANTTVFDQAALMTASQRLNSITTELQESVMKTRMQPIGSVWAKFPRVVRDVSHELGKKVRLIMDGQSTELDRTIIEAIKDPLTHIVRNSIDHGIESPEKRRDAGKAEEGLLSLRAYHEGGQVNIEIMDDGAGINLARVKAKAVSQNLITAEQSARLSEREAVNLIFLPGLSTAEKVSNVSGRGVGMDVVKTNIEKIGGSIDLQTQPGQGTTLKIKIPLTLAIIPALIVKSGGNRYAIPQVSLLELVRLEGDQARTGIERVYGAPVYRLRGELLPLAHLREQLKTPPRDSLRSTVDDEAINIVVLQADGRRFGLIVDEISDTEEIVVKPLGKQLKGITCFAGATIMGDGRVALIIDVLGLAQYANVAAAANSRALDLDVIHNPVDQQPRQSLLLFSLSESQQLAVPLSEAVRLEEFTAAQVERAGGQEVVQYRGQILPLIRVANHIAGPAAAPSKARDMLQVIVYCESGKQVGLIVDCINDIVEEVVTVRSDAATNGILGSIVIHGKVTDLLDVPGVVRSAIPGLFDRSAA